jgi:hypothetical protein
MDRRAILRPRLVGFLAVGAALFAVDRARAPSDPGRIEVPDALRESLEGEGPAALEAWIDREVLLREATRLGLDRGDPIVKRRMVQKMEFLFVAGVDGTPTDAALAAWMASDPDRYRRSARVAFEHVFFSRDRRASAAADARAALAAGEPGPGDPFAQPRSVPLRAVDRIDRAFGAGFAAGLLTAPEGAWSGPLMSAYGPHLVRVSERVEARFATLEEARPEAARDWRAAALEAARAEGLRAARARYEIASE